MSRIERAAEREPGLYPFGTTPPPSLTAEEEAVAPFEDRLKSIWRYIVRRTKRFCSTLNERELAHLDPEDLAAEIVVALLEKDHKWDPQRARYVTFCESVMRNVISVRREQARVVAAPANSSGRLKRYRELAAQGKLSAVSKLTMRAIEAALGDTEPVGPSVDPSFGADRDQGDTPELSKAVEIMEAIRGMEDPRQALVLGQGFGLFGTEERGAAEIGEKLGMDARQVRALQGRAKTALRRRIEKLRESKKK